MTILHAPNVCLLGPAGTGKTRSIGTLADALTGTGEVFYLGLESGLESLIKYYSQEKKRPLPPNLHWHVLGGAKKTFADLKKNAENINQFDQSTLAKMTDPKRSQHNAFIMIQEAMCNFPDDRTGQKHGAVDDWGPERWIVIDGLTGLCGAAMANVIGGKPMRSQPDWGIAQDQVEVFLRMVCDNCPCGFVLLSHVTRETDEVMGGVKLMPDALGKALPPKIAPMFSDVILTVRQGTTWTWDTVSSQADVKARNIPWAAGQNPDFTPLVANWRANVEFTAPAKASGA